MRVLWTKKAEASLDKIVRHTIKNFSRERARVVYHELRLAVDRLAAYPELGRRIGGNETKRQLIVAGNSIVYEIVMSGSPYIVIRNVRPRGTA